MSDTPTEAVREATIPNRNGLHSRPVIRFVDMASSFGAGVSVTNVTRNGDTVDGKSPMEMMLLEATQGCVLRIETVGSDAVGAAEALVRLIETLVDENDT